MTSRKERELVRAWLEEAWRAELGKSPAGPAPIDPAAEALFWLQELAGSIESGPQVRHAREIMKILAEPRLPEKPTTDILDALTATYDRWEAQGDRAFARKGTIAEQMYAALYEVCAAMPKQCDEQTALEWLRYQAHELRVPQAERALKMMGRLA
jgi:hypothetical protein